jgi:flagellar hook-associated protein 3 FlgL
MVDNAIQNMSDNLEALNKLQEKVYSGKQFQTPSDDPLGASISLNLKSNLRTLDSYVGTADLTKDWMTASDFALQQMEDAANRAINLVTRGLNDTFSGGDRATALGTEMQGLLAQATELGNTSQNGQYIFSGYQVNKPAFLISDASIVDYKGDTVTVKTVTYDGDQGSMQRSLGPGQSITLNIRGDQAFNSFYQALDQASRALIGNDTTTLRTALDALQSSLSTMDQYRTSNGARLRQVQLASDYLEKVKIETKSLLSKKEDTNLAEGISLLRNQETTYQAVLEVSQRAISALSLFDYLQ